MPTVTADDIVGFAPGTRGITISPDDIVGHAPVPTYFPQTVTADDIAPTAQEQSTLEAPEGSPQREDINRSVAGNIFAPPGAFARQPTLSETINASMPRGVQESQRDEGRIPLAPPLPDQGAFEQGGIYGVTMPAVEATGEMVSGMVPHDWKSYLESIYPPAAVANQGAQIATGLIRGDVSAVPFVGRVPEIIAAEQTPAFSKERYLAAEKVLNDVGMLAAGEAVRPESPIRTEPFVQEPPPTESLGPGTIAGDVSRALERRFELQPTPPPDIAPAPTIEETLAQSVRNAPQMPVDPDITQSLAQRVLAQRTLTPDVLRSFAEQAQPLPQPGVAREPLGLESETAVEKAMRTTSQSPLQSAIDVVRGQETPSLNLPGIPGVTRPPIPVEQPVLPDQQRIVPSETAVFTPPPGTRLQGKALVGPNGETPAADVAAAATQPPPLPAEVQQPRQTGFTPQGSAQAPAAPPLVTPGDERYAYGGAPPTEGAQLPSAQLPESGFSTERAQALYGKDAVLITEGHSAKAWKAIGKADPRNAYDVLEQSRARGIATPKDAAKLRDEHSILQERARQAYGTPEYNDLAQNAVDFLNASKEVAHGPASEIFRVLQEADEPTYMSPADYDNILRERQMQATPDETATFEKVANEVKAKDTAARTEAANGQEAIRKYKPNEVVPFDEASNYIKQEIKKLTEPCPL